MISDPDDVTLSSLKRKLGLSLVYQVFANLDYVLQLDPVKQKGTKRHQLLPNLFEQFYFMHENECANFRAFSEFPP